jgi:type II secretory pathway component GspD/PulD (secretin)
MKRTMNVMLLVLLLTAAAGAQSNREKRMYLNEYVSPEELVSMSKSLPFDKAMLLFSDFSKKYMNKIIVDVSNNKQAIGVDVENTYWYSAFENILKTNGMWYDEREEFFYVYAVKDSMGRSTTQGTSSAPKTVIDSTGKMLMQQRDVKISSIFFSVNVQKSLNAGVNWNFLYGDKSADTTKFGGQFFGGVKDPNASTSGSGSGTQATAVGFLASFAPKNAFANISALMSFFSSTGLGDVLANPSITVSSGKPGRIQVGNDIYIDTKDFSGNVIKTAISSGIIINVTPTVYEEQGIKFINLEVMAENSAAQADGSIAKTTASTYSVLFDGEETVIGGLYFTSEEVTRGGIPFLKDLPWWVFGLKYVFGFDQTSEITRELIILIKADIIPTIEERVAAAAQRKGINPLEEAQKRNVNEFERLKPKK